MLAPPLIITEDQINLIVKIIDDSLVAIGSNLN
jgi:hypothetical protein